VRAGVDAGGTFTDVVASDGTSTKVLSTRADPAAAVAAGVAEVTARAGATGLDALAHGTTVATNAVLERRGAPIALVTTRGFADVIEIARQNRPSLYDPFADRPAALVERGRRLEVDGRLDAQGVEIEPLGEVPAVPGGVECVAVSLLHADLDASHERAVARVLRDRGLDVTCSHEVSPEFREYERTVTTVLNAYLRPVCRAYLSRLAGLAPAVEVMTSAGGLVPVGEAAGRPAALVLSGPAAGVQAAAAFAVAAGRPDCVTFDMGGTSTDVCLVLGGDPAPAGERWVGGFPVRLPSLDIHTIGAGGGSLARLDVGGALRVGPESAGADPGPACYGRGGAAPTVTDADLVAGRIPADASFPGLGRLDRAAARRALERAGVDAAGVIDVVDAAMTQAIRAVSIERGVDPRGLALVAFGGAGPLHACALADALGMAAVVVPPRAGVLSSVGLLGAARQADLVRSWPTPGSLAGLGEAMAALAAEALGRLGGNGPADGEARPGDGEPSGGVADRLAGLGGAAEVVTAVDCRYAGQSHEITVARVADFPAEHRRRNGYARDGAPIEVVALRASARRRSPIAVTSLPAPGRRRPAAGPAVLSEPDCTVWLPEGWSADVDDAGSWVLTRRRDFRG